MTYPTQARIKAEFDAFFEFPDGSDRKTVTTTSALLFAETIASMFYAAGAEKARADYEREHCRHVVPLPDALKAMIAEAVLAERDRCCAIIFGQCGSDNVAQRTVDAIRDRAAP